MLIDDHMPAWEILTRHGLRVGASPERAYAAVRSADLAHHPVVRGLLAMRALPSAVLSGRLAQLRDRAHRPITLAEFEQQGFALLAESPPHELVLGLEGRFWRPDGDLRRVTAATFSEPVPPGVVRAAWNFAVHPIGADASLLTTETRVLCGEAARSRFRVYWAFVGWGSGVIRRMMLRTIKSEAERRME